MFVKKERLIELEIMEEEVRLKYEGKPYTNEDLDDYEEILEALYEGED